MYLGGTVVVLYADGSVAGKPSPLHGEIRFFLNVVLTYT